ncbi:Reverse transcriptase domain [Trinorchestia longiramus]|nr:Reverse transcriptase domain [Trinorchestia longiramus]
MRPTSHPSLPYLNNNITSAISTHSRQTWIDKVQTHSLQQNPSQFWSLLKSLSGKFNNQPPNQPITFGNRFTTSDPIIAQSFCCQFTIVLHFRRNKSSRKIFRSIHKLHPLDRSFPPFTADQTREAIKKSGTSTAAGPDNFTILHIHHLGPLGITYLTNTNLSLSYAPIPSIWKTAIIITIPKPGKPPSLSSFYRLISLLCPAVKHRPPLCPTIKAIDFAKAFDTVSHPQLISQISSLPLNHHIVCYLKGRPAKCSYHHHLSSSRPVLVGVPQGSVISPALFNLYVSDYPPTAPLITLYANDFTALATTINIPDASAILSSYFSDVATWAQQKGLSVSIAKSQSSLFTPDTHQFRTNPHVTWEETDLTHCRSPKILGITFDTHITFIPHINTISERTQHRLNILKALAGSSWVQQNETITLTYKTLINSIFSRPSLQRAPNRILQLPPLPISEQERSLPRFTRTLLSQLRSGHSRALNSYQARIEAAQDPTCPACGAAGQITSHPNIPPTLPLWTSGWTQCPRQPSSALSLHSQPTFLLLSAPHPSLPRTPESPPHHPLGKQQQHGAEVQKIFSRNSYT